MTPGGLSWPRRTANKCFSSECWIRCGRYRAPFYSRSSDWIHVSFKLTQGTPDGPPAAGVNATLGQGNQAANKQRVSDDKGAVDFGVVQPGDWQFGLYDQAWGLNGTLNVLPGETIEKTIVCPRVRPRLPISVRVDWPPDLAEQRLATVVSFRHDGFTFQPPLHWNLLGSTGDFGKVSLFCEPGSRNIVRNGRGGPVFWRLFLSYGPQANPLPDVGLSKRADLPRSGRRSLKCRTQACPGAPW